MARFEVYADTKKEWRWRFVSSNGRILAVSSEGYKAEKDCLTCIKVVQTESTMAPVNQLTTPGQMAS